MRTGGTRTRKSCAEAHYVVGHVTGEKTPPDDEGNDRGQDCARSNGLVVARPTPADPIGGQKCRPDGDEVLLEVEEAKYLPVAGLLQCRSYVNAKVEIDNG